ncbi:MAG: glycoside hydrolase family 10 protein, partial [Sediminibacterium sp.]
DVLLKWWNEHGYGKHIYIGMGIYRAGTNEAWKNKNEIPNQIKALRAYNTTQGSVYFNSMVFERNPNGWNDSLRNNYYYYPALVPPMPWLNNDSPEQPTLEKSGNNITLTYTGKLQIKGFGVFVLPPDKEVKFINSQLVQVVITNKAATIDLTNVPDSKDKRICVATVDINNNISPLLELK